MPCGAPADLHLRSTERGASAFRNKTRQRWWLGYDGSRRPTGRARSVLQKRPAAGGGRSWNKDRCTAPRSEGGREEGGGEPLRDFSRRCRQAVQRKLGERFPEGLRMSSRGIR